MAGFQIGFALPAGNIAPIYPSTTDRQKIEKDKYPRIVSHSAAAIAGFTLLEIIAAILIFSILITALFTSFRSISNSAEILNRQDAFYQSAHIALSQMVRDLQSIYITRSSTYKPPGLNGISDPYRISCEPSSNTSEKFSTLRFASFEHIAINGDVSKGIAQIVYYSHKIGANQFVLRRADHAWPFSTFKESVNDPILCEKLKSMQFKFQDAEDQTRDQWDSDSSSFNHATPQAIEIKLEIGDETGKVSLGTVVILPISRDKTPG